MIDRPRYSRQHRLLHFWFGRTVADDDRVQPPARLPLVLTLPLLGLAPLFAFITAVRRTAYRYRLLKSGRLPRPTLVIGNITLGGSGKTPVLIALAQAFQRAGYHPGIISRGYGARNNRAARPVSTLSCATETGDEPLLIALRTACPVWIGADRLEAGMALLKAHPECDLILSDDGLQHYRLQRDVEIAVLDERGIGSGRLLPAGPLREPVTRLKKADLLLLNGVDDADVLARAQPALKALFAIQPPQVFRLRPGLFYRLGHPEQKRQACDFAGQTLYAIAAIGHPQRFFNTLHQLGLTPNCRSFADHHVYSAADLAFARDGVLLMTEKDAVKCTPSIGNSIPEAWVLPVDADLPAHAIEQLLEIINEYEIARHPKVSGMQSQPRVQ